MFLGVQLTMSLQWTLFQVMTWHQADNEPSTEPITAKLIDEYIPHQASMS